MPPLRFARVETALGPMWLAETDAGVAHATRSESPETMLAGLRRRFPRLEALPGDVRGDWVRPALNGGPLPPVDLRGLPLFDAAAYRVVRDVAALVGSPLAARAVGNAIARCPLFPAVPCHRVVRASDGWSGWGGDPTLKRRLLSEERRRPNGVA